MKDFIKGLIGITFFFGLIFGGCYISGLVIPLIEKVPMEILLILTIGFFYGIYKLIERGIIR